MLLIRRRGTGLRRHRGVLQEEVQVLVGLGGVNLEILGVPRRPGLRASEVAADILAALVAALPELLSALELRVGH